VGIALNLSVDLVIGARAKAQWMLDWTDVAFHFAPTPGMRSGVVLTYLADKDDREQVGREKPLPCSSCCRGGLQFTAEGSLVLGTYCPAHHVLFYRQLQAKEVGLEEADMLRALFATPKRLTVLPCGGTLVRCKGVSRFAEVPASGVAVATQEEEAVEPYSIVLRTAVVPNSKARSCVPDRRRVKKGVIRFRVCLWLIHTYILTMHA
jgi:hypothetical protein